METKNCRHCCRVFERNKKYSEQQWIKSIYCSQQCKGNFQKDTEWTHTEETRQKLSIAHKGTKKPFAGKYPRTEKHRESISNGLLKMYSIRGEEIKSKLSRAHKGRKASPQTLQRMRENIKLRKNYKGGKETAKKRKCFSEKLRRANKFNNGGKYSLREWEQLVSDYGYRCPCCLRKEPEIKITADHIIPLSKGGTNDISNIQPLCHSCNSKKNTKTIRYAIPR